MTRLALVSLEPTCIAEQRFPLPTDDILYSNSCILSVGTQKQKQCHIDLYIYGLIKVGLPHVIPSRL